MDPKNTILERFEEVWDMLRRGILIKNTPPVRLRFIVRCRSYSTTYSSGLTEALPHLMVHHAATSRCAPRCLVSSLIVIRFCDLVPCWLPFLIPPYLAFDEEIFGVDQGGRKALMCAARHDSAGSGVSVIPWPVAMCFCEPPLPQ